MNVKMQLPKVINLKIHLQKFKNTDFEGRRQFKQRILKWKQHHLSRQEIYLSIITTAWNHAKSIFTYLSNICLHYRTCVEILQKLAIQIDQNDTCENQKYETFLFGSSLSSFD